MSADDPVPTDVSPPSSIGVRGRFGLYMVISFLTKTLLTILLVELLHLEEFLAYAIALVVGSIQNFFILMYWVYRTAEGSKWRQFVKFVQSIAGFQVAEWLLFLLLEEVLGMRYKRAMVITMTTSVALKYFVYKTFVFRGQHPPRAELASADLPPDFNRDDDPEHQSRDADG